MSTIFTILIALLIFCFLIFIHEFGHFIVAKLCKIKVNEFALGMGPTLFKFKKKETLYSLKLFPVGGYCAMEGEDEESSDENAFNNKSVWKRILVVIAGAFMNILLGLILVFVSVVATPAQNGFPSTVIDHFKESPVSDTYLKKGDKIIKINNQSVYIANDINFAFSRNIKGEPMDITVIRNGEKLVIKDVEFPKLNTENGYSMYYPDFKVERLDKSIVNVFKQTAFQTRSYIALVYGSLGDLLTGKLGIKDISGPVGITTAIGSAVQSSDIFSNLIFLITLITINLGIFNLLPFPALDGGRLVFLIIEGIRRKPINRKYEAYIHFAGLMILFGLIIVVTFKDIFSFFG